MLFALYCFVDCIISTIHMDPALLLQDIWMYPGIALFYPKLAQAVLEYRVRTMGGAKDNAEKQGYKVWHHWDNVTIIAGKQKIWGSYY